MALGMKTNQACLGCHEKFAEQDALEDHTHHLAKSSGSLCYNCHMPHTSYGLLTAMRTHHIDVPVVTPLRSNSRPNACNLCHLDQTLAWSARHLSDWYGTPEVDLDEEEQTVAASLLWALRGDAGQRVITAWHFGWASAQEASGDEWMAPFLARLLDDPYSVIRFVAFRSLRSLPGFADFANAYDAPPAEQAEQVARALEIWKRNRTDASNPGAARLLLDTSNELRTEAVRALLERRDNRPVGSIE